MTRKLLLVSITLSAVSAVACYTPPVFPEGIECAPGGGCPDGQFCDTDNTCQNENDPGAEADAGVDAGPVPLDCEPNSIVCENDQLTECNAEGDAGFVTDCALGCHDTEVRCNKLDPSNGLAEHLDDAEENGPDVILSDGAEFNTNTGVVTNGDGSIVEVPNVLLPAPNDGIAVRVFKFGSLTLGDTAMIGQRGVAIVSGKSVEVVGTVRVQSGAGGTGNCTFPTFAHAGGVPGGPGGGFGAVGGAGGIGNGGPAPGGGFPRGTAELVPLRGGCSGKLGCIPSEGCPNLCSGSCPVQGIGGGAIQVVAGVKISVGRDGFSGAIEANGTGAEAGVSFYNGGGGSGGGLLLEAPAVAVTGTLAANGGGGSCQTQEGSDGSGSGAPNGAACAGSQGSGGSGGTNLRIAAAGAQGTGSGGGGGGSVGRIRVNSSNSVIEGTAEVVSPSASLGTAAVR